jgi:hypothetical protein
MAWDIDYFLLNTAYQHYYLSPFTFSPLISPIYFLKKIHVNTEEKILQLSYISQNLLSPNQRKYWI